MAERDENGRFGAGNRVNPGGRSKAHHNVIALARKRTLLAIKTLTSIMRSSEDEGARVKAATVLLELGWGKPVQSVKKTVTHIKKSPRDLSLEELERHIAEMAREKEAAH